MTLHVHYIRLLAMKKLKQINLNVKSSSMNYISWSNNMNSVIRKFNKYWLTRYCFTTIVLSGAYKFKHNYLDEAFSYPHKSPVKRDKFNNAASDAIKNRDMPAYETTPSTTHAESKVHPCVTLHCGDCCDCCDGASI